jgi:glycosyltransferase involved in cell wall biosynthesis
MITLYTMAYNEEVKLQFMIDHYKKRFPNCYFVIYDNYSTDNTHSIAEKNGCEIRMYDSNNQIDDINLRDLKNTCWKDAKTDWVLVCDVDELLDISEQDLIKEEASGSTIIRAEGWNMINLEDNYDLSSIKYGLRHSRYDKSFLFNKKLIKEINYNCGAHVSEPIGSIILSDNIYKLYHYHVINTDFMINRYKYTAERLSEINRKHGMGSYHLISEEEIKLRIKGYRTDPELTKILP